MKNSRLKTVALAAGLFAAIITKGQVTLDLLEDPYEKFKDLYNASTSCNPNAIPWYEGGNNVTNAEFSSNLIGTCNDKDFILKANNKKLVFITKHGNVGIGPDNNAPNAILDISADQGANYLRIHGDANGSIEASGDMNLYHNGNFLVSEGNVTSPQPLFGATSVGFNVYTQCDIYGGKNFGILNQTNSNWTYRIQGSNGKTNIGYQSSAPNAAQLNVNVASSSAPVSAFEIYDQAAWSTQFKVQSNGQTKLGYQPNETNSAKLNINVTSEWGVENAIDVYEENKLGGATSHVINFRVKSNGQTIIGNQSSAPNTAQVNINVASVVSGGDVIPVDAFDVFDQYTNKVNFRVKSNGFVYAREVNVLSGAFPDFVFEKNYKLMPLNERENYISVNKHLPHMISAKEIEENGGNAPVGKIMTGILQNTEDITLYVIEMNKKLEALAKDNEQLKQEIEALKTQQSK